ncbi:unnamed protein product [Trichogramma brassicae]|uniref:Uncharacterized protein n=1 Tax=Trichogramma brassicae TaxID=86971 RepID=A0A6H5ITU7_9HYME|nr:unnamed protein product [Trichogramma brassicae]
MRVYTPITYIAESTKILIFYKTYWVNNGVSIACRIPAVVHGVRGCQARDRSIRKSNTLAKACVPEKAELAIATAASVGRAEVGKSPTFSRLHVRRNSRRPMSWRGWTRHRPDTFPPRLASSRNTLDQSANDLGDQALTLDLSLQPFGLADAARPGLPTATAPGHHRLLLSQARERQPLQREPPTSTWLSQVRSVQRGSQGPHQIPLPGHQTRGALQASVNQATALMGLQADHHLRPLRCDLLFRLLARRGGKVSGLCRVQPRHDIGRRELSKRIPMLSNFCTTFLNFKKLSRAIQGTVATPGRRQTSCF